MGFAIIHQKFASFQNASKESIYVVRTTATARKTACGPFMQDWTVRSVELAQRSGSTWTGLLMDKSREKQVVIIRTSKNANKRIMFGNDKHSTPVRNVVAGASKVNT